MEVERTVVLFRQRKDREQIHRHAVVMGLVQLDYFWEDGRMV